MSEYLKVQTEYRDEALLQQAIQNVATEMGIPVEEYPQNREQHLLGYQGDVRPETAQFIIRRQHLNSLSNDLGWSRQPDGAYRLIISDFDRRQVHRSQDITARVDVEYQRLYVERQVQTNPRLRGSRVVAKRNAMTGVVQLQIVNVRV